MEIHIEDLSYDNKRKMVQDGFTPEMASIVQEESERINQFLRAHTIMTKLGRSQAQINEVIDRVCKYGYVAFEIVYDDNHIDILGLVELDVNTLVPGYKEPMGKFWSQHLNTPNHRLLLPGQVLYLSNVNSFSRVTSQLYRSL